MFGQKQNVCCIKRPISGMLSAIVIFITWQTPKFWSLTAAAWMACNNAPIWMTICTGAGKWLHTQLPQPGLGQPLGCSWRTPDTNKPAENQTLAHKVKISFLFSQGAAANRHSPCSKTTRHITTHQLFNDKAHRNSPTVQWQGTSQLTDCSMTRHIATHQLFNDKVHHNSPTVHRPRLWQDLCWTAAGRYHGVADQGGHWGGAVQGGHWAGAVPGGRWADCGEWSMQQHRPLGREGEHRHLTQPSPRPCHLCDSHLFLREWSHYNDWMNYSFSNVCVCVRPNVHAQYVSVLTCLCVCCWCFRPVSQYPRGFGCCWFRLHSSF